MEKEKTYIYGNASAGLYYGRRISYDPITQVAVIGDCRHICRWDGKTGGITSLAAHGICGPQASQSLVGAPCPQSTQTAVVSELECTPEAAESIEAVVQTYEA